VDITGIRVSRNFKNSSLFTASRKSSPSAVSVYGANHACNDFDISRKPVTSLKQILRQSVTFFNQIINVFRF
jgi:hypothetical protein